MFVSALCCSTAVSLVKLDSVCVLLLAAVMPLTKLTDAQSQAALASASADLKFHLAEKNVPQDVQLALFHAGFINLQLFAGLDESRAEARDALAKEIGLKHTDDVASRIAVASVLPPGNHRARSLPLKKSLESKVGSGSRSGSCSFLKWLQCVLLWRRSSVFCVTAKFPPSPWWPPSLNSLSKVRLKLKTSAKYCAWRTRILTFSAASLNMAQATFGSDQGQRVSRCRAMGRSYACVTASLLLRG